MNDHPKAVGDRSALAVMIALHEVGISFYVPLGDNTRCDFVVELGNELARPMQNDGAVRFRTCSSYAHHPKPKQTSRHYLGEVDYFAVYCPETSGVYLIPIQQLQTRHEAKLRIDRPRNNQRRYIRFAADYQIAKVSVVPG
jgi:PD-(D/E)XK endonuclease